MTSIDQYKNSTKIKSFVTKLFECRQIAHNVHLSTKSYAQHKALNSFYDEILEFTDSFVETFQGQYGIITGYEDLQVKRTNDIIQYMEELVSNFKETRKELEKDPHLQNIVDEIIALTYKTIYKLKNLK